MVQGLHGKVNGRVTGLVIFSSYYVWSSKSAQAVTPLTCIYEVPSLNLYKDTDYPDSNVLWSSLAPSDKCKESTSI
jgi:hypothetical protein